MIAAAPNLDAIFVQADRFNHHVFETALDVLVGDPAARNQFLAHTPRIDVLMLVFAPIVARAS